jgi:hypothetical protein
MKLLGITKVDFGIIDQRLINFLYPADTGENCNVMAQYIIYLYISRKPTFHSGGKYYTVFSLSLV